MKKAKGTPIYPVSTLQCENILITDLFLVNMEQPWAPLVQTPSTGSTAQPILQEKEGKNEH